MPHKLSVALPDIVWANYCKATLSKPMRHKRITFAKPSVLTVSAKYERRGNGLIGFWHHNGSNAVNLFPSVINYLVFNIVPQVFLFFNLYVRYGWNKAFVKAKHFLNATYYSFSLFDSYRWLKGFFCPCLCETLFVFVKNLHGVNISIVHIFLLALILLHKTIKNGIHIFRMYLYNFPIFIDSIGVKLYTKRG